MAGLEEAELQGLLMGASMSCSTLQLVQIPHPRHHRSQPDRRHHQRHCTRADTIRPSVAGILQRAAIGMKRPIGAHQQQRFTDRLGHQQAVKRITVMERQLLERQQVGEVKG